MNNSDSNKNANFYFQKFKEWCEQVRSSKFINGLLGARAICV